MEIEADAVYDTHGTRLTCVTLADGDIPESKVTNGKRKHDEEKAEEEEGEEGEN